MAQRAANIRGFAIATIVSLLFVIIPYSETSRLSVGAQALSYGTVTCQLSNPGTLGDGSEADPWQISTSDQLFAIHPCQGSIVETKYFELVADIDVAEASSGVPTQSPIGFQYGDGGFVPTSFQFAVLDGKGHEISYSMTLSSRGAGLFRDLHNVTFSNLVLRGSVAYTGSNQDADDSAGALAVEAQDSSFLAITNHVEVSGFKVAGGLVGTAAGNMTVQNSGNYGAISASSQYVGGLFGQLRGGSGTVAEVASFSNYAAITAGDFGAGGAIGAIVSNASVNFTNVSNFGEISVSSAVTSGESAGGLIGSVEGGSSINFDSVLNTGTVSAAVRTAGGLIGQLTSGTSSITNSVNEGAVSAPGGRLGGFIGNFSGDGLEISASTNSGPVSVGVPTGFVGGFIGFMDKSSTRGIATFSRVLNQGDIGGDSGLGGLVGFMENYDLNVVESRNTGSVVGTGASVGGILGIVGDPGSFALAQSYNSGLVSGSSSVGGLIGENGDGDFQVNDSYNAGLISSPGTSGLIVGLGQSGDTLTRVAAFPAPSQLSPSDGLASGFVVASGVSASYTFTTSTLVSTSTLAELRVVDTYVGWDFDTVWGFGGCDLNSGYPVLRWAHAGTTFFDQSCGVNSSSSPVVSSGSSGGAAPAPTRTPTAYAGPILDASRVVVEPGTTHTLSGKRLQTIHTVRIEGLNAAVLILTSTSLTITLPASLTPGTYDLVVFSAHGKLTVNAKFEVVKAKKVIDAETEEVTDPGLAGSRTFGVLLGFQWSARFTGNSRDLSQMQVRGVSESLEGYPAATTVVCWGYTTETTPGDWAIEHATKRAEGLCNAVAGLREDVKLYVRVRFGQSKFAAMRATMQFWESKQPI